MTKIVVTSFQPKTSDRTTEGAATMTPHDRPRETRKKKLVRLRVLESKRRSRYS